MIDQLERPAPLETTPDISEVMFSQEARELRDSNELASVYTLRRDLARFGEIRAVTRQHVLNNELTHIAEGLDAPLFNPVTIPYRDGRLMVKEEKSLMEMLEKGAYTALQLAEKDPRNAFYAYRAENDWKEGLDLEAMMAGKTGTNTMVSFSPFPEETARTHGDQHVIDRGFRPDRKMAFMRLYHKLDGQTLQSITISLDNSNLGAFRRVARSVGLDIPPEATSDQFTGLRAALNVDSEHVEAFARQLINTYDDHLRLQHEEVFHQGRKEIDRVDALAFIKAQEDLVYTHFERLKDLAEGRVASREVEIYAKRVLMVGFWRSLKERLEDYKIDPQIRQAYFDANGKLDANMKARLSADMDGAARRAAADYDVLIACGGAMSLDVSPDQPTSIFDLTPDKMFAAVMLGSRPSSETITWTRGKFCRIENCYYKTRKTEVGDCRVCRKCQVIFDDGKDPASEYAKQEAVAKQAEAAANKPKHGARPGRRGSWHNTRSTIKSDEPVS